MSKFEISTLELTFFMNKNFRVIFTLMGDSRSCIDLILSDQPNLIIESGVHPSLHEHCHHRIIYGKLSVSNIARPPYTRRIWYYDKADFVAIMKSIEIFNWHEHLKQIKSPNEQVKLLNEVLLHIYSNFIPNQVKAIQPRKLPWMTQDVKRLLRKKNHAYRTFVKNGQPEDKLEGIQMKGSLLVTHGKLFILLQQRVWIERFVYTFQTIDWIQWHPVFHNYDFLHFLHTIKAWNTL